MTYARSSHRPLQLAVLLAGLASTGCPGLGKLEPPIGDQLPDTPTWSEHVKPLLDTYCNECHSSPPQQAAPETIRLDVCENLGPTLGAKSQANRIIVRTIDELPTPMPPANYAVHPSPDEEEILRRWVDQGASCDDAPANNGGPNNGVPNNGTIPGNNGNMPDMGGGGIDAGMDAGMDAGTDVGVDAADPVWTFAEVATFMRTTCGLDSCHGADGGRGNLSIPLGVSDANLATTLMGNASNGQPFVSSFEPMNSQIYVMMTADAGFMPPGGKLPAEAAEIRAWIEAGADFGN